MVMSTQAALQLPRLGEEPTWREVQTMLTADEWIAYQGTTEIPWSTMYEKQSLSKSKTLPDDSNNKAWSSASRIPFCPFEERDVAMPISPEGDINMKDYMWVRLTGILSKQERAEIYDALDVAGAPNEEVHWPTWQLLRDILNEENQESGVFHGHPQTGWMYFKDVATLILRDLRNVRENPKMMDLNILWKYVLTMVEPFYAAEMELLVLRKDVTRQMSWDSITASRERNINDQIPLIEGAPMMIRSVIDSKYCVDWQFQNIAIPPYLNTPSFFHDRVRIRRPERSI